MERLTIAGFDFTIDFVASNLQSWPLAQALKKLQQYEDAEEQGRLVVLPEWPVEINTKIGCYKIICADWIERTITLLDTRAEAEAALKAGEADGKGGR